MGLQIETRRESGVNVICLTGTLDDAGFTEFDQQLDSLIEAGHTKIVVDGAGLVDVTTEFTGSLLSQLIRVKNGGGDIVFCEIRSGVESTLELLGLQKLIRIFPNLNAACSAFKGHEEIEVDAEDDAVLVVEVVELREDCSELRPRGSAEGESIEILDSALTSLNQAQLRWLVIDGSKLEYMSSNGLGVFIAVQPNFSGRDGAIVFHSLNEVVHTTFRTLGLHRLFPIFETQQQALDHCSS